MLQYFKIPEKKDKRPPPKANTSTASKRSKTATTALCRLNFKNAIRNRPTRGYSSAEDPSSPLPEEGKP